MSEQREPSVRLRLRAATSQLSAHSLSRRQRGVLIALVTALLLAGSGFVYASGGTQHAWLHILYLPVVLAAWGFGAGGGVVAGAAAGVILGPLMPADAVTGEPQQMANWVYRLGFFAGIGGTVGTLSNVLREQLARVDRALRRFTALMDRASDLAIVVNRDGTIAYSSAAVSDLLGLEAADLVGTMVADLIHPEDRDHLDEAVSRAEPSKVEVRAQHVDGAWRHLEITVIDLLDDPEIHGVVLNAHDMTHQRAVEAELRHQALHDPVTGLANRRLFHERLEATLEADPGGAAVLVVDLDRFQQVAETLGNATGEQLVRSLAHRLSAQLRPEDLLARYGGDELALLCPDAAAPDTALNIARRIRDTVREPLGLIGEEEIRLTASIGVVITSGRPREADDVVAEAYTAMRRARKLGGDRYELFQAGWRSAATNELRTEHALHGAVERGELRLHYQPIVNLEDGTPVGFEALVRWDHPRFGVVPPVEFIPIAERTGLILPIGRWVLEEACHQLAVWRRKRPQRELSMSINLSAKQLEDDELPDTLRRTLSEHRLAPSSVTLELTETALVEGVDQAGDALQRFREVGVELAVDDFGTGYSSLRYLQELPLDTLKIDRAFINQLPGNDTIVSAVVGLARTLGLGTVAEGVETSAQAHELQHLGCRRAQGFHFWRPQPAHTLDEVVTQAAIAPRSPAQRPGHAPGDKRREPATPRRITS